MSLRRGDVEIDAAALRRIREEQAFTLRELGRRSGLDFATISRLENNQRAARLGTVRKLADALGVKPRDLMKGHNQ